MRNREYQRRASRQALEQIGASLVPDTSGFYRPEVRPTPGASTLVNKHFSKHAKLHASDRLQGVQLDLFMSIKIDIPSTVVEPVPSGTPVQNPPDQPLIDLFPEAYADA